MADDPQGEDAKARLRNRLVELMGSIDLDKRYYSYYEACQNRPDHSVLGQSDFADAMAATPRPFRYDRRENFFGHLEPHDNVRVGLNVRFAYSEMELILVVVINGMHVGAPMTLLARSVAEQRDPAFEYRPRAPRVRVTSHDELADAVRFAMDLFEDARRVILGHDWVAVR
jgi:hypothetical protein